MADHEGNRTNYHYDPDGNLESITNNTDEIQAQYSYDNSQRLARRTLGNGIYTEYGYDTVSRLIHVATYNSSNNQVSAYAYSYDVNSRRTGAVSQDGSWAYSYDATGQLTDAAFTSTNQNIPSTSISYDYDAVGNRIVKNVDGTSVSYTSNALNQYSAAGNFSYSYDNDGNLVTRTNGTDTWSYTYDELNRLVSSTSPEGNKEYTYNGLGQLAQVITDGVATSYITDPIGLGNLVGEYDDNGDLAHRYTHGLGLLAKNNDFYTFDGNGNTSELTDNSGQILNYYVYTPFGKVLYDVENTDNDFEFVGQFGVRHMNSDFTYMRNRFYMPSTGRFYSEDPIGLAGGDVSFYRYVGNDPINFIDPWGLEGYPYYPTWSDVQTASQDVVSATTEGVSAAIDLTINGPAPASSTLQSAMAITAVPLLASYAPSAYIAAHNTLLQYAPQATAIAKALYDLEGPEGPSFISRSKEILDDLIKSMNEKCPNNK